MINNFEINEELCRNLWKYIEDVSVTDIRWNGNSLWINDLTKGRYLAKDDNGENVVLDEKFFLNIFCNRIANANNVCFNVSSPVLQAETPELRIEAIHPFVTGNSKMALTIRKTPAVARLHQMDLIKDGYADELTIKMLPCLMRAHLSGIVCGDVGSGKTEIEKYLIKYIPENEAIITVEDTLEMKADILYPEKDIITIKTNDRTFDDVDAIKTSLRCANKWLILAESRGKDILRVIEGASTGETALTSIHVENTWDIPDRIMNMSQEEGRETLKNDVFTFFTYAIKVKQNISNKGIKRNIDQITFFTRENGVNKTTVYMKNGELTGETIPESIIEKMQANKTNSDYEQYENKFLKAYTEEMNKHKGENNG